MPDPKTSPRPGRWRRRLIRLAAVLAIFAVLDLVLGTLLAATLFPPDRRGLERSETLGIRSSANLNEEFSIAPEAGGQFTIQTNSQGFRYPRALTPEPPPGALRIFIVGDSHTFATADTDKTFSAQLEALLRADGKNVEVVNAGVQRYSPYQSYLRAEQEVMPFHPHVLIHAIYCGNDLLDLLRHDDRPWFELTAAGAVTHPPTWYAFREPPLPLWSDHSFAYQFYRFHVRDNMYRVLMARELVASLGGSFGDAVDIVGKFASAPDRDIVSQSLGQLLYFRRFPASQGEALRRLDHVVELHRQLAARQPHDVRFVVIPTALHIEPDRDHGRRTLALASLDLPPAAAGDDEVLHDDIQARLRRAGARVIDVAGPLKAAVRPDRTLYWSDYHINLDAMRIIAAALRDDLADVKWP